jgi:hypothetical protein
MNEQTNVKPAADEPKFRANSDYRQEWNHQGIQVTTWRDGTVQQFNPKKASPECRFHAEQHGWDQRTADSGAIELDKIPNKADRIAAKKANRQRLIDHYESGSTSWTIKAVPRATGPDMGLLVRAMGALGMADSVDVANEVFEMVATKREITRDEVIAMFWAAPDIALKVADLRIADKPQPATSAADLIAAIKQTSDVLGAIAGTEKAAE